VRRARRGDEGHRMAQTAFWPFAAGAPPCSRNSVEHHCLSVAGERAADPHCLLSPHSLSSLGTPSLCHCTGQCSWTPPRHSTHHNIHATAPRSWPALLCHRPAATSLTSLLHVHFTTAQITLCIGGAGMDYFLKVKNASLKVASQGINLIQTVGQDMGLSATAAAEKTPVDEFTQRFQSTYCRCCMIIECAVSCKSNCPPVPCRAALCLPCPPPGPCSHMPNIG
jgi:hypothetical protein